MTVSVNWNLTCLSFFKTLLSLPISPLVVQGNVWFRGTAIPWGPGSFVGYGQVTAIEEE